MTLKFPAFALLGSVLILGASGVCRAQVEVGASPENRQSRPNMLTRTQHWRIVLPIEHGAGFGVILVDFRVNGKPAVLILDTGSSATILSPEASGLDPSNLRRAAPPKKGAGFARDARWGEATLVAGGRVWKDHRVLVAEMNSVSGAMHRKIDGILGQDILDEFKHIEIDFDSKHLVLESD